jgi:hypothetical protein
MVIIDKKWARPSNRIRAHLHEKTIEWQLRARMWLL